MKKGDIKMRRRLNLPGWPLILFCLTLLLTGSRVDAALSDSEAELLLQIFNAHKENVEKIRTWKGTAEVIDLSTHADGKQTHQESKLVFFHDQDQGKRTRWSVTKLDDSVDGKLWIPRKEGLQVEDEMITKDGYFTYTRGFRPAGSDTFERTLAILPPEKASEKFYPLSRSFDPLWYFTTMDLFDYGPTFDDLLKFSQNRNEATGLTVSREGQVVTVEYANNNKVSLLRFDMSKGGSMIERKVTFSSGGWTMKLEYEEHDKLWVPSRFTFLAEHSNHQKTGREVIFKEQVLNEEISEKEFSFDALEIKPGAHVADHRTNSFYEYKNEALSSGTSMSEVIKSALKQDPSQTNPDGTIAEPVSSPSVSQASSDHAVPAPVAVNGGRQGSKTSLLFWGVVGLIVVAAAAGVFALRRKAASRGR